MDAPPISFSMASQLNDDVLKAVAPADRKVGKPWVCGVCGRGGIQEVMTSCPECNNTRSRRGVAAAESVAFSLDLNALDLSVLEDGRHSRPEDIEEATPANRSAVPAPHLHTVEPVDDEDPHRDSSRDLVSGAGLEELSKTEQGSEEDDPENDESKEKQEPEEGDESFQRTASQVHSQVYGMHSVDASKPTPPMSPGSPWKRREPRSLPEDSLSGSMRRSVRAPFLQTSDQCPQCQAMSSTTALWLRVDDDKLVCSNCGFERNADVTPRDTLPDPDLSLTQESSQMVAEVILQRVTTSRVPPPPRARPVLDVIVEGAEEELLHKRTPLKKGPMTKSSSFSSSSSLEDDHEDPEDDKDDEEEDDSDVEDSSNNVGKKRNRSAKSIEEEGVKKRVQRVVLRELQAQGVYGWKTLAAAGDEQLRQVSGKGDAGARVLSGLKVVLTGEPIPGLPEALGLAGAQVLDALPSRKPRKTSSAVDAPPKKGDVLVFSEHPRRSLKFLLALVRGTPIVHPNWAVHSLRVGALRPLGPYLLPGSSEQEELAQHARPKVFQQLRIEVVGTPAFKHDWRQLIAEAGGRVVERIDRQDRRAPEYLLELVLSESDPTDYYVRLFDTLPIPVVLPEWAVRCIQQNTLLPIPSTLSFNGNISIRPKQ